MSNDIIATPRHDQAPTARLGGSDVRKALSQVEAALTTFSDPRPFCLKAWSKCTDALNGFVPLAEAGPALAELPGPETFRERADALDAMANGETNSRANRLTIGLLIDSFPTGRPPQFEAYLQAILYDVDRMGFSPAAVALACRTIRTTATFLPSVAEIVKACEKAKEDLSRRANSADWQASVIERLTRAIAAKEPSHAQ